MKTKEKTGCIIQLVIGIIISTIVLTFVSFINGEYTNIKEIEMTVVDKYYNDIHYIIKGEDEEGNIRLLYTQDVKDYDAIEENKSYVFSISIPLVFSDYRYNKYKIMKINGG